MATVSDTRTTNWTVSEIIARFGDFPISRICTTPPPGEATEADVIEFHDHHDRLFELIDGTLLEKTAGWRESVLTAWIMTLLCQFVRPKKLGLLLGPDGIIRLDPQQIRIPDVTFISRDRYAGRKLIGDSFWELGCDLAVEIISPGNTRREMERKLDDYFSAGVRMVWNVYPAEQTVVVFTTPHNSTTLTGEDRLEGGSVLPGFSIPVAQLFTVLDESDE